MRLTVKAIISITVLLLLASPLLIFVYIKTINHRAETDIRSALGLPAQPITPDLIRANLYKQFPPAMAQPALIQSLKTNSLFTQVSASDNKLTANIVYRTHFWPPCTEIMQLQFYLDPPSQNLKFIEVEFHILAP